MSHTPVLLKEVLEYLRPRQGEFIIDGTVNGGGHANEILSKISPSGTLLAIDLDQRKLDLGEILLTHTEPCLDTGLHVPKLLTLQDIMK